MAERDAPELRSDNERRVIAAIRARGALSRAEIARLLGLSAPGASAIVGALADRGLLSAQSKVRGHIGQPITPFTLDPEGACAIGVKIGTRSVEAVLIDFLGEVVAAREAPHPPSDSLPEPDAALSCARAMIGELLAEAPLGAARFVGLGVATPVGLPGWRMTLPVSASVAAQVQQPDVVPRVVQRFRKSAVAIGLRLVGRNLKDQRVDR